jgi:hypothetical protein
LEVLEHLQRGLLLMPVFKAQQVQQDLLDQLAQLDHKDRKVFRGILAQLDHKDRKVFRGILGLREQQDQQEPQALLQPLPLVRPLLVRQAQTHP